MHNPTFRLLRAAAFACLVGAVTVGPRQVLAWSGLAVGNVIGSNILNIFAILGATGVIRPLSAHPEIFNLEIPIMLAFSIGLFLLAYRGMKVARWQGAVLLAAYFGFLTVLVIRGSA